MSGRRFTSWHRAEEFARAVDGVAPVYDAALEPMVAVAGALRATPEVVPSTGFRDSLRDSLLSAAATELAAAPRTEREQPGAVPPERSSVPPGTHVETIVERRRRHRLVVLASSLVLVGGMSGAAAASQQALPGDTLYPIKRGIEQVQLGLAGGAQAQGQELLEQAETRLAEVERLAAGDIDNARVREDITTTLQRFASDAGRGGDLLVQAYEESGDESDLVRLRSFTNDSAGRLSYLADDLPAGSQAALRSAVTVIETLDQMAIRACPSCTGGRPAVDLEVDLLSLPQAGDGSFLGAAPPSRGTAAGDAGGAAGSSAGDSGRSEAGTADGPAGSDAGSGAAGSGAADSGTAGRGGASVDGEGAGDPGGQDDAGSGDGPVAGVDSLPLPTIADDILDGPKSAGSGGGTSSGSGGGTSSGSGGGVLESDGPVLGDDGVLGKDGPVVGDEGLAGSDGPLLGDDGVAGSDGPLLGDDGLLGKDGLLLGDRGVLGQDGPLGSGGGLIGN